mmetsp:Transcript_31607/g.46034  ORF Transcript_31607/g.46034 Transcript_31607/m.46034 type:complete len:472 (-) Transcript_31607:1701-3116(-)|eukprot:CAMPEP_0116024780 /NCGR_PEP_ID=MMETSP0321-20121206/12571_1 /TAXON_ID=163516 /ORGANISM="Leptocylindrus danicus var. danicus, Strain B650" /LENGTH=471 /DNA_ID=CAMNT_0003496677 /DNA_START=1272 /DNA_END=2687 /DNA_ORIENTATION=+
MGTMKTKRYLQNATLNEQMDILVEKIDAERKRIQKVNSQIEAHKIQNIEQQKKVGGVDAIKETSRMIDKTRKIIEARLNQSLVKFDEHVDQNRKLRKQIDDLRQERVVYDSIYKKLERELQIKATEMKRIVEEGRTMIISRERAMSEVQELQRLEQEEKNAYEREYREFEQQKEKFEIEKRKRRRLRGGTQPPGNGDEIIKQVTYRDGLKDGIELEHAANESQSTIDLDASNDFNCNETITKIKDATGFASVDEIINQLSEAQNKNFSLFNYCSDATAEIEGLEMKLTETRADMEQYKNRIKNSPKKKAERLLIEKRKKFEASNQKYQKQIHQLDRTLIQFKEAISRIFASSGCAVPQENGLLENHITDTNIIQYLAIIEQRVMDLIKQSGVDAHKSPPKLFSRNIAGTAVSIDHLPTADDFSSGEGTDTTDDDERPLTRAELAIKTRKMEKNRRLTRRVTSYRQKSTSVY